MTDPNEILKALSSSGNFSRIDLLLGLTKPSQDNYITKLADKYGCTKGFMHQVLKEMEKVGLVYYVQTDYAKILLWNTTSKGRKVLKDIYSW
ncbi:MAG: hypothetical protein NXI00_16120 [Cytophagales bacterium]|nr:hypothetical protein [Cytophagales bacterium]